MRHWTKRHFRAVCTTSAICPNWPTTAVVILMLIPVNVLTRFVKRIRGGRWILVVELEFTEWISPTEEMEKVCDCAMFRAGLTIRGPHPNVRRGPFSHTRSQDFLWAWACTFFSGSALFFPPKRWRPFLVVVVRFKPTLNVQTSKQRCKNFASWSGPLAAGEGLPWYNRYNGQSGPGYVWLWNCYW